MLFTKKIRPAGENPELRRVAEHINYMQETLEIKYTELVKRLEALEKAKSGEEKNDGVS